MPSPHYILNAIRNGYCVAVDTDQVDNATSAIAREGLSCHVLKTTRDDKKQINPGPEPAPTPSSDASVRSVYPASAATRDASRYSAQLFTEKLQQLEQQEVLQQMMADYELTRTQVAELTKLQAEVTTNPVDRWLLPGDNDRWLPVPQPALDLLCRRLNTSYEKTVLKCRDRIDTVRL